MASRTHRWVALLVALMASAPLAASAAPTTRSHPLGIWSDDAVQPSAAYVRFTAERMDRPFAEFAAAAPSADGPERAFVDLVEALRADDVPRATRRLDPRHLGQATPAWMVDFLRKGWLALRDVAVVGRMRHGGEEIVLFRVGSAEGAPWIRALAFNHYMGRWQARVITSSDPSLSLIIDTLTHGVRAPSRFKDTPNSGAAYAIPLDAERTIWIEFDGVRQRFDPIDGAPQTEAGALFQQSMRLLAASDWDGYAALFTPASAAKIREGVARQDADTRKRSGPMMARGTEVRFEIDLGPAGAIIVYSQGNIEGQRALRTQYVARTDDGLRLTNFFMSFALDLTLMHAPGWPKYATPFEAALDAGRRGGKTP